MNKNLLKFGVMSSFAFGALDMTTKENITAETRENVREVDLDLLKNSTNFSDTLEEMNTSDLLLTVLESVDSVDENTVLDEALESFLSRIAPNKYNKDSLEQELLELSLPIFDDMGDSWEKTLQGMENEKALKAYYLYYYLGITYRTKDFEHSSRYFDLALEVIEQYNLSGDKKAHILFTLGSGYQMKEKYDLALDKYTEVLLLYENTDIENHLPRADALTAIGCLFIDVNGISNINAAIHSMQEAIDIYKKLNVTDMFDITPFDREWRLISAQNNLGRIYLEGVKRDSSQKDVFLSKAKNIFHQTLSDISESDLKQDLIHQKRFSYNNLGLVAVANQEWQNAFNYYDQSLHISDSLKYSNGIAIVKKNISDVFKMLQEISQTHSLESVFPGDWANQEQQLLEEARDLKGVDDWIRLDIFKSLVDVYKKKGEQESFDSHYEDVVECLEEILRINEKIGKENLQKKYGALLRKMKRLLLEEEENLKNWIVGSIGSVIFLISLFVFRASQKNKKHAKEMDEKNEELRLANEALMAIQVQVVEHAKEIENQNNELSQILLELKASNLEEQKAHELLTRFVAVLGHELKNAFQVPIMAMDGAYLDVVEESIKKAIINDPEIRDCITKNIGMVKKKVYERSDAMHNIEILFNKMYKLGMDLQEKVAARPELVRKYIDEEVLTLSHIRNNQETSLDMGDGKGKHIRIVADIDSDIDSDFKICLDKGMITVVINTLVHNACKFSHDQGVITVGAIKQDRGVLFSIADTGIGIKTEALATIFDSVKRKQILGKQIGTSGEKGTGYGLLIARDYVSKHGGKIWVESDGVGKGSIFYFFLPQKKDDIMVE